MERSSTPDISHHHRRCLRQLTSPSAKCTGQWQTKKVDSDFSGHTYTYTHTHRHTDTHTHIFIDTTVSFLLDRVLLLVLTIPAEMSSAANSFLRLNSTVSQPGSPTSCKSEKQSLPASAAGASATSGRCDVVARYLNAHPRFKKALGHIGLVILLGCYTAAGAAVSLQSIAYRCVICVFLHFFPPFLILFYTSAESVERALLCLVDHLSLSLFFSLRAD